MLTVFSSGTISIVKNEWARTNQTEFYRMVARLMPREVEAKISSEFTLVDALMEVEDYVKYERTLTDNGK